MTREEMQAVAQRHLAAESARDLVGSMATFVDDCFYENTPIGLRVLGREAVALQYAALFEAIPDGHATFEGEAWGDDVLVHWGVFHGTVRGAFMGLPASGRRIELPLVGFIHFRDGLMAGERLVYDLAALSDQVGQPIAAIREASAGLRAEIARRSSDGAAMAIGPRDGAGAGT